MKKDRARLALFSAIEGGQVFWSSQILESGTEYVYEKLVSGGYYSIKYGKMIEKLKGVDPLAIEESIFRSGAIFLTPESSDWPELLDDLAAPPIGLVVKGDVKALTERALAIVGTRNPTPYGVRIAGEFAAGFVDREWNIISGGAYGIDSAAHKGALIAEGATIAVLATGIDVAYPAGNARLFTEISENGALISEVLP